MIKKIIFPIVEILLGNRFLHKYRFLRRSSKWNKKQIEEYQLRQLKGIMKHAYKNVPFYTKLYDKNKIDVNSIKKLSDIKKLPIISKKELRGLAKKEIVAKGRYEKALLNRTAGSTGTPFEFYMDKELKGWKYARYIFLMEKAGHKFGRKYMKLWGESTASFAQDIFTKHVLKRKEINAFKLNNSRLRKTLSEIKKEKPRVIESYASTASGLAKYALERGIKIHIPVIITSAENLQDYQREDIKKAFGAKVVDRYGSREFGNIAQECREGNMHVLENNFLVEEIDGRIIVTCFDNYTMPFIRYDIGDIGRIESKKCNCGKEGKVIKGLEGRTSEIFVTPDGKRIPPTFFYYAVDYYFGEHVNGFQVILEKNKITIKIVARKSFTSNHKKEMIKFLRKRLGKTKITIEETDNLPLTKAGKKSAIINRIKK